MNSNAKKSGELQAVNGAAGSHRRGIVLVVDDEAPLLVALERRFRLAGLHPLTCATIEQAKRLLDSWVVHVVVCDERLADGSGAYFLVDVGRQFPGVGRILLSGFMEPYFVELGIEHGFATVEKESSFPDLLALVRREIGSDA